MSLIATLYILREDQLLADDLPDNAVETIDFNHGGSVFGNLSFYSEEKKLFSWDQLALQTTSDQLSKKFESGIILFSTQEKEKVSQLLDPSTISPDELEHSARVMYQVTEDDEEFDGIGAITHEALTLLYNTVMRLEEGQVVALWIG